MKPFCKSLPGATETGVVPNYSLTDCVTGYPPTIVDVRFNGQKSQPLK